MVSMAEKVKYILFLTIGFLNDTFFFNQVLLSRILSWLAIYLQNDLNFSENITLTVHKDMIVTKLFRIIMEIILLYDIVLPKLFVSCPNLL